MPVMTEEKKQVISVSPFTIEIDHPRNCDVVFVSLSGVRLRSALKAVKQVFTRDRDTGEQTTVPAPAKLLPGLPGDIPGMRLKLDPARGDWKVTDPLRDNEPLCEKIKRAIEANTGTRVASKLRGAPPQAGKISRDEMKTLCREVRWLLDAGEAKVLEGVEPDLEEIDALPGDYLSNPGNLIRLHQPRYEKDMEKWVDSLNRVGG